MGLHKAVVFLLVHQKRRGITLGVWIYGPNLKAMSKMAFNSGGKANAGRSQTDADGRSQAYDGMSEATFFNISFILICSSMEVLFGPIYSSIALNLYIFYA